MSQTQAVVFAAPDEVQWRTIEMPPPRANEVQIRTEWSVVSAGTEGWALQNRFTWSATTFPCVPGYQRVGTITALGEGVTQYAIGQRVMATRGVWDAEVTPFWGSHVALANTPADDVFALPDGCDALDAAGAVVAQVGYNAAFRADLQTGDWVLVLGDGLIGQCAAQAARACGLKVLIAGHRDERLMLGAQFSADATLNSHDENFVDAVRERVGQPTVAAVLDTVQTESSQLLYMPLLQNGRGQIVYSGFTPGTCWANMAVLQQRELTTHFIAGWNRTRMEATLQLMAQGKMQLRPLLSHIVAPSQAPQMYRMIREKSEPFLGIAFDWSKV